MCYKKEKHRKLSIKLEEKMKDVPDFISNYFDSYKSAATKNCNWGYVRDLLQWLMDKKYIQKESLSEISTEDMNTIKDSHVIKYFDDLQHGITRRKNTLDSIGTKRNVLHAFWGYLFRKKYVDDNILESEEIKKKFKIEKTEKVVKMPSDEQLELFICRLNNGNSNEFNIIRNLTIVNLFLGSGIRSEELINLDVKDLHLSGGKKESGAYTDKPFINVLGKGKIEKYESVIISPKAKTCLQEYLKFREIFAQENSIDNKALFLSNERKRISKTVITNLFYRYSDGEIYPHMIRHWVGTKLYEKTKDIVLVQKQLRHSSLETAAKYYVHMDEDKIADAMAEL